MSYSGVDGTILDYQKHLGFTLDSKMNYMKNIDGKIAKGNQGICII